MRKAMTVFCAFLALFASAAFASPAHAIGFLDLEVPPPSDKIVIDVITVNGSGCPAGTAAVAVSPDNTAFTVTYSDYLAQVGVGSKPTDFRKNCQLNVVVHVPSGFTYAVAKVDNRGFAALAAGASAIQSSRFYFQGQRPTAYASHRFNGSMENNWIASDEVDIAALVWAPCGVLRNLNINTELRVNKGTSDTSTTTSFIMMDSTDGELSTIYHFHWAQCPTP